MNKVIIGIILTCSHSVTFVVRASLIVPMFPSISKLALLALVCTAWVLKFPVAKRITYDTSEQSSNSLKAFEQARTVMEGLVDGTVRTSDVDIG